MVVAGATMPDWAGDDCAGKRRVLHAINPAASKNLVRGVAFAQVSTSTE
jgi:hypothetical protein